VKLTLGTEEVRFINLFEMLTGAGAKDCIVDAENERVIFVVSEGEIAQAIGKGGANVHRVETKMNKKIDVIEYSKDPLQFVRNLLHPIKPKNVYLAEKSTGEKVINVEVERRDKSAIFASGKRLYNRLKMLLNRYHGISNIEVQ
jgi:N utilization substance protein A